MGETAVGRDNHLIITQTLPPFYPDALTLPRAALKSRRALTLTQSDRPPRLRPSGFRAYLHNHQPLP